MDVEGDRRGKAQRKEAFLEGRDFGQGEEDTATSERNGNYKDIARLSCTISTSVPVIVLVDVHGLHVGYKGCFSVETRG